MAFNMQPLVTVCVLTYNASESIIETLTSIENQTYRNIELIISDDCSPDDTVRQCQNCVEEHKSRFVRAEIITVPQNTGIPANANRACCHARGEWIKTIGDDILAEDAIETYVSYTLKYPEIQILFAKAQLFHDACGVRKEISVKPEEYHLKMYDLQPFEQFKYLLEINAVAAPTTFIKKSLFAEYGFDERFKYMEDYPLWLRLTHDGIKLHIIDKISVYYRMTSSSLSKSNKIFYNPLMMDSVAVFFYLQKKEYIIKYRPELLDRERKLIVFNELTLLLFNNKRNFMNRIGRRVMWLLLNIFHYK